MDLIYIIPVSLSFLLLLVFLLLRHDASMKTTRRRLIILTIISCIVSLITLIVYYIYFAGSGRSTFSFTAVFLVLVILSVMIKLRRKKA